MMQIIRYRTNPGYVDIASRWAGPQYPYAPATLSEIVDSYESANGCEVVYAMRGGFMVGGGDESPAGRLATWGIERQGGTGNDWPMLAVYRETALLTHEGGDLGPYMLLAAAGPTLLRDGRAVTSDYRQFRDTGPDNNRPRTAIGIRPDGALLLVAVEQATLAEVAQCLRAEDCTDALAYDGGSGTQVMLGDEVTTWEGAGVRIPWAWVVRDRPRPDAPGAVQVDAGGGQDATTPQHPEGDAMTWTTRPTIAWDMRWGNARLSAHFWAHEFHSDADNPIIFVSTELLARLETLRALIGDVPITVNSGYRAPDKNASVGGATYSQHQYGLGTDLAIPAGVTKAAFSAAAREAGLRVLDDYPSHIHVDLGKEWMPV